MIYVVIFKRYGDDHRGKVEPFAVTICCKMLSFKEGSKKGMYLSLIDFIKKEMNFFETFEELEKSLFWNASSLVRTTGFGMEKTWRDEEINQIWEATVDSTEGLCYTFDPKKHGYPMVPLKRNGNTRTSFSIHLDVSIRKSYFPV